MPPSAIQRSPHVAELGRRVRERREELELSQEQVGARVGLHRTYVGHVERAEVSPSLDTLVLLALGLEVDLGALTSGLSASATEYRDTRVARALSRARRGR